MNNLYLSTHSPYVLSTLNNLLYAGNLSKDPTIDREKLKQIVPEELWLDADKFDCIMLEDGKCESIMDPETGLINALRIDQISSEINSQFDNLMDLKYAKAE